MQLNRLVRNKIFVFLCFVLIIIDFLYPITFTPDSAHYFSYLKILNGTVAWQEWDPVRGPVFPYFLKFVTDLLGYTPNALLIIMTFFHIVLFTIACCLIMEAIHISSSENWLIVFVFVLIALDPLIFGFYHTLLTEFLASFIAALCCFLAFLLYKNIEHGKSILTFFSIFSLLTPLAWHLKQPYFGASFFPLVLISFLIIINKTISTKVKIRVIAGNLVVLISLGISIILWNQVLSYSGASNNPAMINRDVSSYFDTMKNQDLDLIRKSPTRFIKNYIQNYLALSNIYTYRLDKSIPYTNDIRIDKQFSLTRAFENRLIAYRMFEKPGQSNILPIIKIYRSVVQPFDALYLPPLWLNAILSVMIIKSTVLFSLLFLLLPLFFAISFLMVMSQTNHNAWIIIFVCSGSAFLNALIHSLMNNPIDRYLFWGYPLLLISAAISLLMPLAHDPNKRAETSTL
jgi:hypothetical protein